MVNITNDAWFGTTTGPYQHFSMAVFRAVENRKPVIRAANTSISGFIDSNGKIISKTGLFQRLTLTGEIKTDTRGVFILSTVIFLHISGLYFPLFCLQIFSVKLEKVLFKGGCKCLYRKN